MCVCVCVCVLFGPVKPELGVIPSVVGSNLCLEEKIQIMI